MTVYLTVQAADAHAAAHSDREARADLVLKMGVREALDFIREGRGDDARRTLTRVEASAARILGRSVQ